MTRALAAALGAIWLAASAAAQTPPPVFVHGEAPATLPSTAGDSRNAVLSRSRVGLRLDVLFDRRDVGGVRLNIGDQSWTAQFERLDRDAAGFRSWVGSIDGIRESHVVFTERRGAVSGLIDAVGITYQIRTDGPGSYLLERVDVGRFGDEPDPIVPVTDTLTAAADPPAAADDAGVFDVLMLYTPAARLARGGTTSIEALVSQVISDTNTAFARSGIAPRVRLAAARELDLTESAQLTVDLTTLRNSRQAQMLRDSYGADLVQLLVHSSDLSSCGVGYLLTALGSTDFPAYSVADIACAAQYTPTHELAHNMGSHHAPEDGASAALFPYSYGFKDHTRGFRTVMAYECAGVSCPRVLSFSNPLVVHQGGPSGTPRQDNARSINQSAHTVANFRQRRAIEPAPPTPPGAPANLRSSIVGQAVTVAWDAVTFDAASQPSAATEYVVQVGTAASASDVFNASIGAATSASGVLHEGLYFWRVIAVNAAGASRPSAEAQFVVGAGCLPPSTPLNLGFSVTNREVALTWTPPATGATPMTYVVEAGSGPARADLAVVSTGSSASAVTTAPPGVYFVRVRATNSCGTSPPSDEVVIAVF